MAESMSTMTPVFKYEIVKSNTGDIKDLEEKLNALGPGGWEIASTAYDSASKKVIVFLKRGYWMPGPEQEDEAEQAAKEAAYSGMTEVRENGHG